MKKDFLKWDSIKKEIFKIQGDSGQPAGNKVSKDSK